MGDLFETRAMRADAVADVLTQAYDKLVVLQRDLRSVLTELEAFPQITVHPDGTLTYGQLDAATDWQYVDTAAKQYGAVIAGILAQAETVGASAATAILDLAPEQAGYVSANEYNDIMGDAYDAEGLNAALPAPPVGQDAASNAAWWAGLSEDQRRQYTMVYPAMVGAMDGLPTLDRDAANRLNLHRDIENGYDKEGAAKLLERIENSDHLPPDQRLYLLAYDGPHAAGEDAKLAIAVGNPDLAQHTAVFVPGTFANLENGAGEYTDIARNIRRAADQTTPGVAGDVATVMWLGYDAPDDLGKAASVEYANNGAAAFDGFVNGLNAAHDPGVSSHVTAIGHSYGTVLVGHSAVNGHHLAVDDVIVAGSPGTGADRASNMSINPGGQVWAGLSSNDEIRYAGNSHGLQPADELFGGNRFAVEGYFEHGDYWTPGSVSLENQAHIITGQDESVTYDTSGDAGRPWPDDPRN